MRACLKRSGWGEGPPLSRCLLDGQGKTEEGSYRRIQGSGGMLLSNAEWTCQDGRITGGRFGWADSDICLWCCKSRQNREYLFKGCPAWRGEIEVLWKEAGRISGSRGTNGRVGDRTVEEQKGVRVLGMTSKSQAQLLCSTGPSDRADT